MNEQKWNWFLLSLTNLNTKPKYTLKLSLFIGSRKRSCCRSKSENTTCWLSHIRLLGEPNLVKQTLLVTHRSHFGEKLVEIDTVRLTSFPCWVLFRCCWFSDLNCLDIVVNMIVRTVNFTRRRRRRRPWLIPHAGNMW